MYTRELPESDALRGASLVYDQNVDRLHCGSKPSEATKKGADCESSRHKNKKPATRDGNS